MFPKKINGRIVFLLLTIPAVLCAIWWAKHAYRYHWAVHFLPYSPKLGILLEKHRQDKHNAQLNPHAPVVIPGDSIMKFWLKERKHSRKTWFSPLGCLNLGTRSKTTGKLLWHISDELTASLTPKIIVLHSGINNLGVQKSLGWTAFQGNVAVTKKIREITARKQPLSLSSPCLPTKEGYVWKPSGICCSNKTWEKMFMSSPSISSSQEKTPDFILGTAFISTPWGMKPSLPRFTIFSNSF